MISRWTRLRIIGMGALLAGLGLFVVQRSVELVVKPVEIPEVGKRWLKDLGEENARKKIALPERRGRILDRTGRELATTAEFDSIKCNPRQLPPDGPKRLAKALKMNERDVLDALRGRKYYARIKSYVSEAEIAAVKALKLPGVETEKQQKRVYPHGELAATVIGHTNLDGVGIEGVELSYNNVLRGRRADISSLRDAAGREFFVDGAIDTQSMVGKDLVLTLDGALTHTTQRALADAVKEHQAKGAVAVVMDPRTGDILSMASVPTYDPGVPSQALERHARNRAITDTYEPGSTMKTFTFVAALEGGKFDPWKGLWDGQHGQYRFGKHTITDEHGGVGLVNGAEIFKHSSNIGTLKIAQAVVGRERLFETWRKFGFGRRTGVGLGGEVGAVARLSRSEIDFITNSYGYSLTVTPLQMATAYSVIAANGVYRAPRLVSKIIAPDGTTADAPAPKGARTEERIISEKTAATMRQLMGLVVEGGTAQKAQIPGYKVGGKTGTAKKNENGRYVPKAYISSFCGIVPLDAPRFVICVAVDDPKPIFFGGLVAAPVFKRIAEEALSQYVIPPTEPFVAKNKGDKDEKAALAAMESLPTKIRMDALDRMGFEAPTWEVAPGAEGEGESSDSGEAPLEVPDVAVPETVDVPNFNGMSLGLAIKTAAKVGIELEFVGSGVAFAQQPLPGPVVRGSTCKVSFRPPGG